MGLLHLFRPGLQVAFLPLCDSLQVHRIYVVLQEGQIHLHRNAIPTHLAS